MAKNILIDFDEQTHSYAVNGELASISVTGLLTKHGLAPDYSGANKALLQAKAEQGRAVHADLENVLRVGQINDYEPTTPQGKQFAAWAKENLRVGNPEQKLAIEYKGLVISGMADVMGVLKSGDLFVGDHKNTAQFHNDYVSWQVSIYDYFARKMSGVKVNGIDFHWDGAKQFKCFHYDPKSGNMTVHELEKVPDAEIERLLDCEVAGVIYKKPELAISSEFEAKIIRAELNLAWFKQYCSQLEEAASEYREELCRMFELQFGKNWRGSWESACETVKVTHFPAQEQVRIDTEKLKAKYPKIFDECKKFVKTKSFVKVTVRNDGNE